MNKCFLLLLFVVARSSVSSAINTTNEGYQLTTNTRKIIYANSICRVFMNTSTTKTYFIPTKTAPEFNSFISNPPSGVVVDTCRSCNDLKIGSGGTLASGVYEIDPDGSGGLGTVKFLCDMTTQGGGWTLVWSNTRGGTNKPVTSITWTNATAGGVRCSTANSSTSDFSGSCSMISSNKEAFNYFVGLNTWNALGRNKQYMEFRYTWSSAYGVATQQEARFAMQKFNSGDNYVLRLSNINQTVGSQSPGIYSYHSASGYAFSTSDADHDVYSGNCSSLYTNSPFWYGACWSGNMNGGGENGPGTGYQNAAYWTGATNADGNSSGDGGGNGWMWIRESDYYYSCAEAKNIGGFINSGTYTIDSDGPGGAAAVSTNCTM